MWFSWQKEKFTPSLQRNCPRTTPADFTESRWVLLLAARLGTSAYKVTWAIYRAVKRVKYIIQTKWQVNDKASMCKKSRPSNKRLPSSMARCISQQIFPSLWNNKTWWTIWSLLTWFKKMDGLGGSWECLLYCSQSHCSEVHLFWRLCELLSKKWQISFPL